LLWCDLDQGGGSREGQEVPCWLALTGCGCKRRDGLKGGSLVSALGTIREQTCHWLTWVSSRKQMWGWEQGQEFGPPSL
jgi:hypothetical protein